VCDVSFAGIRGQDCGEHQRSVLSPDNHQDLRVGQNFPVALPATVTATSPHSCSSRAIYMASISSSSSSTSRGRLASRERRMRGGRSLLVKPDELINLAGVGAVILDRCPDQAKRDLQVTRSLSRIAVVVANDGDHFPDVLTGADEPGTAAGRAVRAPDERVLVHPRPSSMYRWASVRSGKLNTPARCRVERRVTPFNPTLRA
jgi:hypothetical protein